MGLMNFFHNTLTRKQPPVTNRDYVSRPQNVGQMYGNIGAVERMMPGAASGVAKGAAKKGLGMGVTKKPRY